MSCSAEFHKLFFLREENRYASTGGLQRRKIFEKQHILIHLYSKPNGQFV
jgi:hypothetical protein